MKAILVWTLMFTVAAVLSLQKLIDAVAQNIAVDTFETADQRERARLWTRRMILTAALDVVTSLCFLFGGAVMLPSAGISEHAERPIVAVLFFVGAICFLARLVVGLLLHRQYEHDVLAAGQHKEEK